MLIDIGALFLSYENFLSLPQAFTDTASIFLIALILTLKVMESRKGEPVGLNAMGVRSGRNNV